MRAGQFKHSRHCSMSPPKILCQDISYRSGFVEVIPGIHDDHVNLEVWNVAPQRASTIVDENSLTDDDVIATTELELSIPQTKELIRRLQLAVSQLESGTGHTLSPSC